MTRSSLLTALALLLPLLLGSCATRLACDFSAPRLHWKHPKTPGHGSEEARVSSYIVGRTENGFTVSEVNCLAHRPQCGLDLLSTFLTLGLIPHSAPNPIDVIVTGDVDGRKTTETFPLSLDRRTSLWHRLLPESCDDRAIARAVLQAVRDRKQYDPEILHMARERANSLRASMARRAEAAHTP
ncbi:MAG: hypothetical protein J0L73_26025 [Verrucomicrobia bacterium]|nr:hypothetical protein [Verrucomicrobiota bacterium]